MEGMKRQQRSGSFGLEASPWNRSPHCAITALEDGAARAQDHDPTMMMRGTSNKNLRLTRCALHPSDLRASESRRCHEGGRGAQRAQSHSTDFHLHDICCWGVSLIDAYRNAEGKHTRSPRASILHPSPPPRNDPRLQGLPNLPLWLNLNIEFV